MEKVYAIYKTMDGETSATSYKSTNPKIIRGIMKFLKRSNLVDFEVREE